MCQDLTRENVSEFLFLCEHIISRSRRDQIKDPRDLLYTLEQLKMVAPDNLRFLSSKLTEIRRQDLAQKVDEHCRRYGIQHLGGDSSIRPKSDSKVGQVKVGQVTPSFVNTLSDNQVVSFRTARVLEPDNAEPLLPPSQHTAVSERTNWQEMHNFHDFNVTHTVSQMQDGDELITRGMPPSNDVDMPCYPMNRKPRGLRSSLQILFICSIYCFFS